MSGVRASVFEGEQELDVSGFAPKAKVKEMAEERGFKSREMGQPAPAESRREPRRHRTGRNMQLNLKVRPQDAEAFYKLADQTGLVLGEVFEQAIAALERDLAKAGD